MRVDQQEHGYRSGHQLLSGTLKLPRDDQDAIDRLSDIAGSVRPGETFAPYLTTYPLPSGSHYVVARTWQDTDAPRAGCVLTRSLLVAMTDWERLESLGPLLDLLTPVSRDEKATMLEVGPDCSSLPAIADPRMGELVEALFLESRQPIVVFEAPEAETIAVRLLTALWPGMRRNFALCTFALSPRRVGGRDFDLLFAPRSARSRFADWPGRRIDSKASPPPARHRWTELTARQIFEASNPSLSTFDALGALRRDRRGDESALRLALLWNELAERAETSPNAVLGMLDVLNSQDVETPVSELNELLIRSIKRAESTLPTEEAWRYLAMLLGKFPARRTPPSIRRQVRLSACRLASSQASTALQFLVDQDRLDREVASVIAAGLGDGLSQATPSAALLDELEEVRSETGLRVLASSRGFAKWLISATKCDPETWTAPTVRILDTPDTELRSRARRSVLPLLDAAVLAPYLSPLLRDADPRTLGNAVSKIGAQTAFQFVEFDEPITHAARDDEALEQVRTSAAMVVSPGADRLILHTLRLDARDVSWLSAAEVLKPQRSAHLLAALVDRSDDRAIQAIQRDDTARKQVLASLTSEISTAAPQMARFLLVGHVPIGELMQVGIPTLSHLQGGLLTQLTTSLLARSLAEAPAKQDSALATLLSFATGQVDPHQIVVMAVAASASTDRIAHNLILLNSAAAPLRAGVVMRIDELTDRLVRRPQENLGEAAYAAWADLLTDAGGLNPVAQARAAATALSFALRRRNYPISRLIVATFPVVYAQLAYERESADLSFSDFFAIPLSLLGDWDRAKTARRELVDAFMRSGWPPSDLVLAARSASIESKILRRVSREYHGHKYIQQIARDAQRLQQPARSIVAGAISEFEMSPRWSDWDY